MNESTRTRNSLRSHPHRFRPAARIEQPEIGLAEVNTERHRCNQSVQIDEGATRLSIFPDARQRPGAAASTAAKHRSDTDEIVLRIDARRRCGIDCQDLDSLTHRQHPQLLKLLKGL